MTILFPIVFIDLGGFGLVIPLLPFCAERLAASPFEMTALFATYSLMSMLTAPLWGRLSDRVGRRPVLMASMAAAVADGRLALARRLWMLFAARACAGNIAAAQAYIADVTGFVFFYVGLLSALMQGGLIGRLTREAAPLAFPSEPPARPAG